MCEDDADQRSKYCMFDYCLTWDELNARVAWFFGEFDNQDLWFDLPLIIVGAFGWRGTSADDGVFADRDATFWTRFAQIAMIMTGAIAAYRSGLEAVQASILATAWTSAAGPGHSFAGYQGNTLLVGDFLGLIESVFSLAFLGMSAELVAGPLYLAYTMDKRSAGTPDKDLKNLLLGAIVAMGAFFGGETLKNGVGDIIGYFNNYNTNVFVDSNGDSETTKNTTAFFYDIGLHSLESCMFLGLAFLIANGCFQLAYDVLME